MQIIKCILLAAALLGLAVSAFALDVIPPREELLQNHPRVLLTTEDTPLAVSLEQLRSHTDHPEYEAMLARISGVANAACQAMVWQLTGDTLAADSAVAILKRYRYNSSQSYDSFDVYFPLIEYALAYDWMYNYGGWTNMERSMARSQINELAKKGLAFQYDHLFHNYTWMTATGTMIWALAAAGEDSTTNYVYDTIRARMNDQMYKGMHYLDGLPTESYGYWSQYDFTGAAWTVIAAQSASNQDIVGKIEAEQDGWLRRHYLNEIHNILPDMRFMPWGDVIGGPNGSVTHEMAGVLDATSWVLKAPEGARFSQWLAGKRGKGRFYGLTGVYYFLYTPLLDDITPAEPALSYTAGGGTEGGIFTTRGDWSDTATVVSFGVKDHYGDHNHYDQGHFTIYRRGLLASDPLLYEHTNGPQQPSDVHSTLVFGGNEQEERHGQNHSALENFLVNLDSGQRLNTGDFLFSTDGGSWAAASGSYAQAYEPGVVDTCVRQLLFIRPSTVVVVDWVTPPAGGSLGRVDWLLQHSAEPVEGTGMTWMAGDSSYLVCKALQPTSDISILKNSAGTWRARFSYQPDSSAKLVHMLKVGDGTVPDTTFGEYELNTVEEGLELKYGDYTYTFYNSGIYQVSGRPNLRGDVNLDGKVNIFDLLGLLSVISGKDTDPVRISVADINQNGRAEIFDLLELLKLL